ncbi:hypothetical protein HK405_013678, partial [Cladochytrium tenue]
MPASGVDDDAVVVGDSSAVVDVGSDGFDDYNSEGAAAAAAAAAAVLSDVPPPVSDTVSDGDDAQGPDGVGGGPAQPTPAIQTATIGQSRNAACHFDFLIALDLETTCDENHANPGEIKVRKDQGEVIELSFAVVEVEKMEIVHQQQIFVKPEKTSLTLFCTNLTGISAAHLEDADGLNSAVEALNRFIETNIVSQSKSFCYVTHNDWDLRYQLPRECREKGVPLPIAYHIFFEIVTE